MSGYQKNVLELFRKELGFMILTQNLTFGRSQLLMPWL